MHFSHYTYFLATVIICASTVTFGWGGFVIALIGLSVAAYICTAKSTQDAAVITGVILLLTSCLVAFLLPFVNLPSESYRRQSCLCNLRQISIALQKYHETYGSFPPAYVCDQAGKPMHSWRVLILPYLGEEKLYAKYNISEPWDSPGNHETGHDETNYLRLSK